MTVELFDKLLDKISEYEIWNNVLPDIAICIILKYLVGIDLLVGNAVEQFFVIYLVGLVNGRVGSLIVEWVFRKFVTFRDYSLYLKAEKKDPNLAKHSAINNKYRAMTSASLISFVLYMAAGFQYNECWAASLLPAATLLCLVVLFGTSYRKQTNYVVERIDNALKD